VLVLVVIFAVATGRLFIWPARGMPAHVDAIVVLGGPGDRLGRGLELVHQDRAPVLAISEGLDVPPSLCRSQSRAPQVICFQPQPVTTQGEAEFAGRLAAKYHWRSIVLVTTPDQDTRARLRFERCFDGGLYVVTTPLPASLWFYQIAYQWAATAKALVLQRSC
jgi:uncharacterized SAM-binding protein YcdF (DUF218 family)